MTTKTFHHYAGPDWASPSSWDPTGVPGSTDAAVVAGDAFIDTDVGSIASLSITAETVNGVAFSAGSVSIKDGGALAVNGDVSYDTAIDLTGFTHGASLTIKGTLSLNGGALVLDSSNGPGNETATIHALQASNESLILIGGPSTGAQSSLAKVVIAGSAGFSGTGVLDGTVNLAGNAVVSFATGQVTTLTTSAKLIIYGPKAFLGSGDTISNSALHGLTSNAGYITLDDSAAVQTTGGLTNNGSLAVDFDGYGLTYGQVRGGSTLRIAGTLTNTGAASLINIGSDTLVAATLVEAAALNNTQRIAVFGSAQYTAELRIDSAASFGTTGVLQGDIDLSGRALLDFTTGQITTIASDSFLTIDGPNAFVADANAETRNSALDGLASIAGVLSLTGRASAALTGSLNVSGSIDLEGGGSFTVAGSLTNSSAIVVGAGADTVGSTLTAGAVNNSGTIAVNSNETFFASNPAIGGGLSSLVVSALTGGGTVDLFANATLEVGGAGNNAVVFSGGNAVLKLDHPAAGYTGAISGFRPGDTLDLANEVVSIQSYDGKTLVVRTSANATQSFALAGPSAGSLTARSDGAGGTDIVVRGLTTSRNDYNGDGTSDILWQQTSGAVYDWGMMGAQHAGNITTAAPGALPTAQWTLIGSGDFNGDGTADLLWQNGAGATYEWGLSNGVRNADISLGTLPSSQYQLIGTGDFNGDRTDDLLWQDQQNGAVYDWGMAGGQHSTNITVAAAGAVPLTAWAMIGTGDFNGDGTTDLLWQNKQSGAVYEWTMSGGQHTGDVSLGTVAPSQYALIGAGDFNGDGATDLLWQDKGSGAVYEWGMINGQHTSNIGLGTLLPSQWGLLTTGDFDGNGTSDLLWQNKQTGALYVWGMRGGQHVSDTSLGTLSTTDWHTLSSLKT